MTFTGRLAWPEDNKSDDFVFLHGGNDVGRCYRDSLAGRDRWLWTIYSPRIGSDVADRGYAESLEAAQDQSKASYLKMFEPTQK